jgi:YD repeat-containing protein
MGLCCAESELSAKSTAPTSVGVAGGNDFFSFSATYNGPALERLQWSTPDDFLNGPDIQFIRDSNGLIAEIKRFRGALRSHTTFAWDGPGRLVRQKHLDASDALLHADADATLTRDAASRITGIARASDTTTDTYDAVDQLTQVAHSSAAAENYNYNAMGVRTSSHLVPGRKKRIPAQGRSRASPTIIAISSCSRPFIRMRSILRPRRLHSNMITPGE